MIIFNNNITVYLIRELTHTLTTIGERNVLYNYLNRGGNNRNVTLRKPIFYLGDIQTLPV